MRHPRLVFTRRSQRWLATSLVLTAGYVDGYGLFAYGTFLSFMSGNTTLTGYNLGRGKLGAAMPSAVAIVGFVVGATVGATIAGQGRHRHRLIIGLTAGLEVIALLLAVNGAATAPLAIGVVSVAMGMLNHAATRIGEQRVSLTFVTGTLTQLGRHLAAAVAHAPLAGAADARDTHARRAVALSSVWVAFLAGALVAGLIAQRLATWALLPAIVAHGALCLLVPTWEFDRAAGDRS
jgi:uncharacterized membrane protein YoaK (UPF0700 family)